jgi:hypothetical protein
MSFSEQSIALTNLTARFILIIVKKKAAKEDMESKISEVMSLIGKRSAEVRQEKWGKKEFKKRMREWGKLGGRPKKTDGERKGKQ